MNCLDNSHDHRGRGCPTSTPRDPFARLSSESLFASLAGFLGHAAVGSINMTLLAFASAASIAGAILGANLMSSRLKSSQVKVVIGSVLYGVALKIVWGLV